MIIRFRLGIQKRNNMINLREKIVNILIEKGNEIFKQPYKNIKFTKNKEADKLLNNLKDFPHAFVLACVMDRQMKTEKDWLIPYKISKAIGGFKISQLLRINQEEMKEIFRNNSLQFLYTKLKN